MGGDGGEGEKSHFVHPHPCPPPSKGGGDNLPLSLEIFIAPVPSVFKAQPPRGESWVAAGSGSAPEGLLPRRESLWLGEGRTIHVSFYATLRCRLGIEKFEIENPEHGI